MEPNILSQTTRHVPRWLGRVVAEFEMFGRDVVLVRDVALALGVAQDSPRATDAIHRLIELGWLRPLPARGAYEFMAARGGPYPGGDPLLEAKAVRAKRPDFRLAIIGSGAAFLRGFSERPPSRYWLAIEKSQGGSVALATTYELVKTTAVRLADVPRLRGVPVSDAARLLSDAALWPEAAGDLRDRDHWLRRSLAVTDPVAAANAAQRAGNAAGARMAYLASRFDAVSVEAAIRDTLQGRARTVFGARADPVVGRDAGLGVTDHLGVASR